MKLVITTCDVCNPNQSTVSPQRGVCMWEPLKAVRDFGWLRKRDGSGREKHVCQECQDKGLTLERDGAI